MGDPGGSRQVEGLPGGRRTGTPGDRAPRRRVAETRQWFLLEGGADVRSDVPEHTERTCACRRRAWTASATTENAAK